MIATISRFLASILAVALIAVATSENWGQWSGTPFWLVSYVAALWLIFGIFRSSFSTGLPTLFGGWAFAAGLLFSDFAALVRAAGSAGFVWEPMSVLAAGLLGLSFAGIFLTALAMRRVGDGANLRLPDDTVFQ